MTHSASTPGSRPIWRSRQRGERSFPDSQSVGRMTGRSRGHRPAFAASANICASATPTTSRSTSSRISRTSASRIFVRRSAGVRTPATSVQAADPDRTSEEAFVRRCAGSRGSGHHRLHPSEPLRPALQTSRWRIASHAPSAHQPSQKNVISPPWCADGRFSTERKPKKDDH